MLFREIVQQKGYLTVPKHTYSVYEKGRFVEQKIIESVRRDILAFGFVLFNLDTLSAMFTAPEGKEQLHKYPRQAQRIIRSVEQKFIPEFEDRKKSCTALFRNESDKQAVRIAKSLIDKIDEWVGSMHENLGLEELID